MIASWLLEVATALRSSAKIEISARGMRALILQAGNSKRVAIATIAAGHPWGMDPGDSTTAWAVCPSSSTTLRMPFQT
eukprot:8407711-Alexandrium_andersonii.AAC.1